VAALKFFLGSDSEEDENDSDSDSDTEVSWLADRIDFPKYFCNVDAMLSIFYLLCVHLPLNSLHNCIVTLISV